MRHARSRKNSHSRKSARAPHISQRRGAVRARCDTPLTKAQPLSRPRDTQLASISQRMTRVALSPRRIAIASTRPSRGFYLRPVKRRSGKRPRANEACESAAIARHRHDRRRDAMRMRQCAHQLAMWVRTTRARKRATARTRASRERDSLAERQRASHQHALAYGFAEHYGRRVLKMCVGVEHASRSYAKLLWARKLQQRRERALLVQNMLRAARARERAIERARLQRTKRASFTSRQRSIERVS